MIELNLPRGYLSYSAIDRWYKSKKEFRRMYYEGVPMYKTPQLEFGSRIAKQYEALHLDTNAQVDHEVIRKIPRGDVAEKKLQFTVGSVPVLGFMDSFDTSSNMVHELKTGGKKYPWTQARVNRHDQLVMYCLGVKSMFGEYNPYVKLHWIETDTLSSIDYIDGISFPSTCLRLTGNILSITRIVHANDLLEYEKVIEKTAREISEDYTIWQRLHRTSSTV